MQEKEARRDEKLRFTCKCSFLEIYNEQILDLLDPSSNNLQVWVNFLKVLTNQLCLHKTHFFGDERAFYISEISLIYSYNYLKMYNVSYSIDMALKSISSHSLELLLAFW